VLECQVFGFRFVSSHASKVLDITRLLVKKACINADTIHHSTGF